MALKVILHTRLIPFRIDAKRFQMPFTLQSKCPGCATIASKNLAEDHYLPNPKLDITTTITFWCSHCSTEWPEKYRLTVNLEAVNEKTEK